MIDEYMNLALRIERWVDNNQGVPENVSMGNFLGTGVGVEREEVNEYTISFLQMPNKRKGIYIQPQLGLYTIDYQATQVELKEALIKAKEVWDPILNG